MSGSYPGDCESVPDDEEKVVDITELLQAYGKRGHGLCGKDADLDYGGQIKVDGAFMCEEYVEAYLQVYASILPPEEQEGDDPMEDLASMIVCNWDHQDGVTGDWDGDYWVFGMKNTEHYYHVKIPFKWNENHSEQANARRAAGNLNTAIWKDKGIKEFQRSMTELAKAVAPEDL